MDLLRTPFGASFHEKLCREYLAFQKWTPTLLGAPVGFFDTPLVDWAGSALAGPTETGRLLVGSQLEQALVYLRGSIAFDEVRRGALPRHVSEGWAGNTKPFILTGKRKYKRLTVNQVWVTIGLEQEPGYLSPDAIIEGRTLALCLIYLLHLLGDDATAIETIRRYVERFYVGQSKYLALLEIHSGLDAVSLFNESADILKRRLWESVANGWYSLHAPVIVKQDDVSQSMTARCVQAARAMRDNDILSFSSVGAFLSAMDSKFSELGARPIKEALAVSAERLAKTISMCADCRDIEMREWYQHILQVIHDDLLQRIPAGYELRTGLPPDGNPMRWVDDAGMRCVELQVAPRRVTEWYELRQLLLTTRDQAKEKAQKLSDFFVNRVQ